MCLTDFDATEYPDEEYVAYKVFKCIDGVTFRPPIMYEGYYYKGRQYEAESIQLYTQRYSMLMPIYMSGFHCFEAAIEAQHYRGDRKDEVVAKCRFRHRLAIGKEGEWLGRVYKYMEILEICA